MLGIDTDLDVDSMNYKQLRKTVSQLYDAYIVLQREFKNQLLNLEDSVNINKNGLTNTQEKLESIKTKTDELGNEFQSKITQTAEYIKTEVSRSVDGRLTNYSTILQTADAITTTVTADYVDTLIKDKYVTNAKLESTVEQTAEHIMSTVSATYETKDDAGIQYERLESKITQTAESITMSVMKNISAHFTKNSMPTKNNTDDVEKSMLCLYNGEYYYYNWLSETWELYPADGIKTMFVQTVDGFELTGDVYINGDMITSGTISGDRLKADVLFSRNADGYFAKMNGQFGDFGIYQNVGDIDNVRPTDDSCFFGIYSDITAINFCTYGHNWLGYNAFQNKAYPKGTWDFSSCNVIGLPTGG